MRLNEKKRQQGLTYAAITLLVIALPIVVVLGVGMGVGVPAAEVVRMNKKNEKKGGGDSPLPSASPYPLSSSWVGMWALTSASAW